VPSAPGTGYHPGGVELLTGVRYPAGRGSRQGGYVTTLQRPLH
jgi:hypothetical protein